MLNKLQSWYFLFLRILTPLFDMAIHDIPSSQNVHFFFCKTKKNIYKLIRFSFWKAATTILLSIHGFIRSTSGLWRFLKNSGRQQQLKKRVPTTVEWATVYVCVRVNQFIKLFEFTKILFIIKKNYSETNVRGTEPVRVTSHVLNPLNPDNHKNQSYN